MKKTGIRKPKPTASSLPRNSCGLGAADDDADDDPGRERAEDHVEAELRGEHGERRRSAAPRGAPRAGPLVPIVVCHQAHDARRPGAEREQRRADDDRGEDEQQHRAPAARRPRRRGSPRRSPPGRTRPTAPAPTTKLPKRWSRMPASRRIGISVPSAVVVSARRDEHRRVDDPGDVQDDARSPRRATSEISQPATPDATGAPRMRSKSISIPARKNRKARPKVDSDSMKSSVVARSSTCGPTRIPRKISATTIGTSTRRERSASTGASTATSATTRMSACATSTARRAYWQARRWPGALESPPSHGHGKRRWR